MAREAKKYTFQREPLAELEDLRDDCIAVVMNSRLTFDQVKENGGPSPTTSRRWLYRETRFPQLATVRAMLRACNYDLTIGKQGTDEVRHIGHEGIQYPGYEEYVASRKKKLPRRSPARKTG